MSRAIRDFLILTLCDQHLVLSRKGDENDEKRNIQQKKVTGLDTICIANKTIVVFFEEDGYADLVKSNHAYKEHLKAFMTSIQSCFPIQ